MRPPAHLVAALWLGATGCQQCARPSPPQVTADTAAVASSGHPGPDASAIASAAATARRLGDLCGAVDDHNRAAWATASAELARSVERGDIPASWASGATAMATPCLRWPAGGAPTSAWAVRVERVADGGVRETTWSLVHVARDGAQVASDEPFSEVCCSPTSALKNVRSFDLDGDGDPEIAFDIEHEGPEGASDVTHHVYTYRGQRVVPYPLPFPGPLRDVDGDGRPDLELEHRDETKQPCSGFAYHEIVGPSLLARGQPDGTFSLTDAVAAAHTRRQCPSRPARVVARDRAGLVDEDATARNLICARAWGAPPARLRAEIEQGCRDPDFVDDCDQASKRRPGECVHRATLLEWAAQAPAVLAPAASR